MVIYSLNRSIYTMKRKKVKRNHNNMLAVSASLGYTNLGSKLKWDSFFLFYKIFPLQYKIPLQIENEDTIVAGLSLRQLVIMMIWGWIAYSVFKFAEPRVGPEISLIFAVPLVVIGITIALLRIAEMTFLPTVLNFFRLSLNSRSRAWSQGTDGYSAADIGYSGGDAQKSKEKENISLVTRMWESEEVNEQILKL